MSFKVIERGTNRKLVYELLLVVYINSHHIPDTSCFHAENHIFATPLVFDLKFEGGIWKRNLAPEN